MFTGIVTAIGRLTGVKSAHGGLQLAIQPESGRLPLGSCHTGDSVAVSGVCLTMLDPGPQGFSADVSAETLGATSLGDKSEGDRVNLELALSAGEPLGGHLVSGHVDAAVKLLSRRADGDAERFEIELPKALARFVARKGSATLDGVSLTVNEVGPDRFSVCIIPHTLSVTTLGQAAEGERLNLEVDLVARYLERLAGERLR